LLLLASLMMAGVLATVSSNDGDGCAA